jgi:hypothetical protein
MGNGSSQLAPTRLKPGAVFNSREDAINLSNEHNHSIQKLSCTYRNQACVLHIVCVNQFRVMKATDKSYTQAKKDFVAAGGNGNDFEKKKYEIVCGSHILAYPVKKRTKKDNRDKQDIG